MSEIAGLRGKTSEKDDIDHILIKQLQATFYKAYSG